MPVILRKGQARKRQPQQAVRIDWSNPITRGLVGVFNSASGLQSNNLILSSGTGTLDGISGNGRALATNANQESRYTTWRRLDASMTMAWLGDLIATPTADASLGGVTHNNTNAEPYVSIQIKRRNGTSDNLYLTWSFGSGTGNYRNLLTAGTAYTSNKNLLLIGSVSSGLQSLSVYQNNALVERVTAANADTINYGAGPRVEMGDSLNARNPNALHNLMLLWNRQLSVNEERALAANPWQIFEKTRREFIFSSSEIIATTLARDIVTGSSAAQKSAPGSATARDIVTASASASKGVTTTAAAIDVAQGNTTASKMMLDGATARDIVIGQSVAAPAGVIYGNAITRRIVISSAQCTKSVAAATSAKDYAISSSVSAKAASSSVISRSLARAVSFSAKNISSAFVGRNIIRGAASTGGAIVIPRVGISNVTGYVGISNTSGYVGITTIQ